MSDQVLDIDVVEDIGAPPEEPVVDEEAEVVGFKEPEIKDFSESKKDGKKRITIPYLTKYEKTRLICSRAEALNRGAIPTVPVGNLKNTIEIAEKELESRKIPLKIKRKLPNGTEEVWSIEELIF